jgi:abortive infection bacteriophage resistance protein
MPLTQKQRYTKPFKAYQEQLEQLKQRGLIVNNEEELAFYLQHLNYYRLAAYFKPFETCQAQHTFKTGTTFEQVLSTYTFDRELRLLVLDAIERIEISIRASWAYQLAKARGSHAHLNPDLYTNKLIFAKQITKLDKEVQQSKEEFIQHFKEKYDEELPPIWAVCEVLTLGTLSKLYGSLKHVKDQKTISKCYGLSPELFESWLHHLVLVRNICAHHSRLWNRSFTIVPEEPNKTPKLVTNAFQTHWVNTKKGGQQKQPTRYIYNTLLILLHFMDVVSPKHGWRGKLKTLVQQHPKNLNSMGFPHDWQTQTIWQ